MKSKAMGHRYKQTNYSNDIASNTIMYITHKKEEIYLLIMKKRNHYK